MTDRDTKFAGFADLLFGEIARRYIAMFSLRISGEEDKADMVAHEIRQLIAQRAYDLVAHTLHEIGIDEDAPFNDATTPADIPDLTKWPESPTS